MILALDCATKTGWALIEKGIIIESGVQDFSKKRGESNGGMFLRFRKWLSDMFDDMHPSCGLVVYEQAHHRGGAATEICVNLTGRVQEMCADRNIEFAAVHTATLKKHATGKGKADKEEMIKKARYILNREPFDDNEADAVLMAIWAYEEYGID